LQQNRCFRISSNPVAPTIFFPEEQTLSGLREPHQSVNQQETEQAAVTEEAA